MDAQYDCMIIGGGLAGLQGAIQLGRYKHQTLVIDKGFGRSTLCRSYHNVLGWPDGISGQELRRLGTLQAERLGVQFIKGEVTGVSRSESGFTIHIDGNEFKPRATTLLLATGIMDRYPELPGLECCLGETIYVCPDCDGYEVSGRMTLVLGAGEVGASMAITLRYWTEHLTYINHEAEQSPLSFETLQRLQAANIDYIPQVIEEVLGNEAEGKIQGVRLIGGQVIAGERGFIAFGGNKVGSKLASELGIERLENKHVVTDPRTKMTSVPGVWAAGDVGVHAEQVTIAMGEGSQAAIWIHKELMKRSQRQEPVCINSTKS